MAAACGGGDGGGTSVQTGTGGSEAVVAEAVPSAEFMNTRPGAGIAAAGGDLMAVRGDNPCDQPGGSEPIVISYVGTNLAELDVIGLEAIVVEEPGLIIEAYTNEVNFNGGINGRCVEFVNHLVSLADPAGSLTQICTDLATRRPVVHLTLRVNDATLECATIGAQLPTIGLYAFAPASTFDRTGDRLFIDDGTVERLLSASVDVALSSNVISAGDRVGLLHGISDMAEAVAIVERFGFEDVPAAHVPPEFADLQLLLLEKQVRLLEGGLTEDEKRPRRSANLAALPPELIDLFNQMEQFFLDAANRFKDAGVTAVAATADWTDMRRHHTSRRSG